jgi:hypothetical protein
MDDLWEKLAQLGSGHDVFHAIWECRAEVQIKLITILGGLMVRTECSK